MLEKEKKIYDFDRTLKDLSNSTIFYWYKISFFWIKDAWNRNESLEHIKA